MRHALSLALMGAVGYAFGKGYFDREDQIEATVGNPTEAVVPLDIATRAAIDLYVAGLPEPRPTRDEVVAQALHEWLVTKGVLGGSGAPL